MIGNAVNFSFRQPRSGFTLIELLVVIAIITILIAILLPAVLLAQRNAYSSATQSTMSSIGIALQEYHTDFHMYPPSSLVRGNTPIYNSGGFPIPAHAAYDYLAEALLGFEPGGTGGDGAGAAYPATPATPVGIQAYKGFSMAGSPQVYGPYMSLGASSITPDPAQAGVYYFADSFPPQSGAPLPILYFTPDMTPAPAGTTIINTSPTTADDIFNTADDSLAPGAADFTTQPPAVGSPAGPVNGPAFLALLGATNAHVSSKPIVTVAGQSILGSNSYLLVSAGPDGTYYSADDLVLGGRD